MLVSLIKRRDIDVPFDTGSGSTDRISGKGKAIGRVRPSIRTTVSTLTFEPTDR